MAVQFRGSVQQKASSSSSELLIPEHCSTHQGLDRRQYPSSILRAGSVVRAVNDLEMMLSKQMKKLFEAELKKVQQYAVDVTLDPDIVHPKATQSDAKQQSKPEKVGMFVDYEEGLVSFYDADTAALIYSFTGCSFTDKLYPFFSPCPNNVEIDLKSQQQQLKTTKLPVCEASVLEPATALVWFVLTLNRAFSS
ncbi:E3 ubiquitin-protein ligase TRIM11-like protein [Lates japonicus]|uniref:E3 ubiquitin-protein ligase TRIM11-like protein n=1 Tax=Lates japonicus TaxID=270547 RepID=A0AAD3RLK2_LATJO|nr:E3 ubiquitin-protein ligase TRIM11-like protein [Lates japonicus]